MSVLAGQPQTSIEPMMLYMGRMARDAARTLALASTEQKNAALEAMAFVIRGHFRDADGPPSVCALGAMTVVPQPGNEYLARYGREGEGCWVELSAFSVDKPSEVRFLPVQAKPVTMPTWGSLSISP